MVVPAAALRLTSTMGRAAPSRAARPQDDDIFTILVSHLTLYSPIHRWGVVSEFRWTLRALCARLAVRRRSTMRARRRKMHHPTRSSARASCAARLTSSRCAPCFALRSPDAASAICRRDGRVRPLRAALDVHVSCRATRCAVRTDCRMPRRRDDRRPGRPLAAAVQCATCAAALAARRCSARRSTRCSRRGERCGSAGARRRGPIGTYALHHHYDIITRSRCARSRRPERRARTARRGRRGALQCARRATRASRQRAAVPRRLAAGAARRPRRRHRARAASRRSLAGAARRLHPPHHGVHGPRLCAARRVRHRQWLAAAAD